MPPLLKSILLLIVISIITFWVTCGGTILLFVGWYSWWGWWVVAWWAIILLGILFLFFILRKFLKIYIWRYIGISILLSLLTYIVGYSFFILGIDGLLMRVPWLNLLSYIFSLVWLILSVYIFHFYRMKALVEKENIGNMASDIRTIFYTLFGPLIRLITGTRNPVQIESSISEASSIHSSESIDLMNSLAQVDISSIHSVRFSSRNWTEFQLETENMIRLAKYVTMKMGKMDFEPHELETIFQYVDKNIITDTSADMKVKIKELLQGFVKHGGIVELIPE